MNTENIISVEAFCRHHNIEVTFITSLYDFDLIQIIHVNEEKYIPLDQLAEAEKIVRLRQDLNLNTEGIEAVLQLLEKINRMRLEVDSLRNRLRLYEDEA